MRLRNVSPWEANHPLHGHPCPVTGRLAYVEDAWKVTKSTYRLCTGILEPGIVLSLPVGYTKTVDTSSFFRIMHAIRQSPKLNPEQFVLVEDYTFHTGSDYEGRLSYIKRMIQEIHPAGIIFITRSTSWKLSIKIGAAFYGSPFPIKLVPSYREAILLAAEILGRPIDEQLVLKTHDKVIKDHFTLEFNVISPSLLHVMFSGCPRLEDFSSIVDFYMGLSDRPDVVKMFHTIHDFSAMQLPSLPLIYKICQLVLSSQYNHGNSVALVSGNSPVLEAIARFLGILRRKRLRRLTFYKDSATAIATIDPEGQFVPVFRENLKMAALELLEVISWDKPGYHELEDVQDPFLKPLALMLGSIKQDMDHYLQQRQDELEKLEVVNKRARELSYEIEQAFKHSEEDRHKVELLSRENSALANEIASSQKEVFLVLADYIDRRACVSVGSTKKRARLVAQLAVLFGYDTEALSPLHDATLLMHVGFLAVPEREENQELHCIFGGEVLGNIGTVVMQYASHIARYHHEKWNGLGYPDRLIGDLIPMEARLVALADYLLTCPDTEMEYALKGESGRMFDPSMVGTLLLHSAEVRTFIADEAHRT